MNQDAIECFSLSKVLTSCSGEVPVELDSYVSKAKSSECLEEDVNYEDVRNQYKQFSSDAHEAFKNIYANKTVSERRDMERNYYTNLVQGIPDV